MKKFLSTKYILTLILLISFLVRFTGIENTPPSLSWDEVSHGYNAFSILKTGHDEWGQFMPLTNFRAYGDYPTTLYMYLLMPVISVFGLNSLSVRLPSVILGSLLPLLLFFLVRKLVKKDNIALITAFMVSLSPWGVLLSRQAIQSTPAIFLMTLGVLLFITGQKKNLNLSVLGTVVLGLSAYAYHNTRIFSPVLLLGLLIIYRKQLLANAKILLAIIISSAILFFPIFGALTSPEGIARSTWVEILDQGAINSINESRGNSNLSPFFARLTNNKVTYFSKVAVKNYFGYFSPHFLATKGGSHYQFSVQGFGVLNPIELPFFYLGLILLVLNIKKLNKVQKITLFWLLASPLPAVITRDPYQVVRVTTMMPAVYLTIAIGLKGFVDIFSTIDRRSYYKTILILGLIFSYFSYKYLDNLFTEYPVKYSQSWQYGYQEAIQYAKDNYDKFEKIIITKRYGEPHEFVLFYTSYDSNSLINDRNLERYQRSDWYWTNSFDKYIFMNDWEIKEKTEQLSHTLLITSPENFSENGQVIKTINFLDGTPAFIIVSLP